MADTAKDKLANVEKVMSDYLSGKGILKLTSRNEAEIYLNMPRDQMRKLLPEECSEAAVILTQYGAFLQDCYNTELSRVNWAEAEIKRTIATEVKQYNSPAADERRTLAINGNEYAQALDKLKTWAQAGVDKLSFMSNRVETVARAYIALAQIRRK